MKTTDRIFGWLLVIASLLHSAGSYLVYRHKPELLLWALGTGLTGLLLAGLNLLRVDRPQDRALAWVCFAGCLGWLGVAAGFGAVVGSFLDARLVIHAVITLVLTALSLRTALGNAGEAAHGMAA